MVPENRVHVGSVTKTFIAVGVLKLVWDGRLSLDTQVDALLPGIRFRSRWSQGDPVRSRHCCRPDQGKASFVAA